ncbi:MAG: diguanylate phosphodiesterase [Mesorhizobium amorphae]|nr:MAG: diguanylate phosphodiesterase [Mesorhizobium amorphae]
MATKKTIEIPEDVYVSFVQTLFRDGLTLTLGLASQALLMVLGFWKTGSPVYLYLAAALGVIGLVRLASIQRNAALPPPSTFEEARHRENEYIIFGTMHGAMLGIFCFVSIFVAQDNFVEVASVCVTVASVSSIAGRNYGSPRMVMCFIVTMILPISLGFMLRGDFYHVILAALVLPFLFAVRRFALVVREVLFTAIYEEKKANRLAQRFNRALNTMSHGLVMLGPDGRVAVANAAAARLMAFRSSDQLLGRSLHAMLNRGVAGGRIRQEDSRVIEAQLTHALREGRDRKVIVPLSNGQHYEFSAREGSQDLGVITFEDVTARIVAEERIRTMARIDSLTGLPNRAYFSELVVGMMEAGDRARFCGLAVIDLDDFKSVNDTLGHPVGDGLICAVGQRLREFVDETVIVSRFGGDEFLVYADAVRDEAEFVDLMDRIFDRLVGETDVVGHMLRIQASGGAVLARVRETDVDALIVRADLALYKAKEGGKSHWKLFEMVMDTAFRNRQVLKSDLRIAVEKRALRVIYQPIIAMESMRIASCEALCRWDHPELGPISPAIFIPLAEEMGIISELSAFVLERATEDCASWPDPIGVSVNLSAKDFRNDTIVKEVERALRRTGLAPHRLEIELTETALLDDKSLTRQLIERMREMGLSIALDDFGTGYSSLSYLHKLPLDKVKIDRSFLLDIDQSERSRRLVSGIVHLSRALGLEVTVEGTETFEQLRILSQSVRPDFVQGFLFGAALSASGIRTMADTVWPFSEAMGGKRAPAGK